MDFNRNLSESLAVLASQCASQAAGAVNVGPINTNISRRVLFSVIAGTPGAGGTVDFRVQASSSQAGTYADVPASATSITQLAAAGVASVEVKAESLQSAGIGPWIRGVVTVGVATSPVAVLALADCSRFEANALDNSIAGTASPVVY